MKTVVKVFFCFITLAIAGCQTKQINLREGVGSDSLVDNIVTRPVAYAFSALIGEGIEIDQAVLKKNDAGLPELNINGHNRSYDTRRFKYRVEWLDADGMMIQTKTSVWLPASAMGKSPFSLKVVAPTDNAVNFRMDTKKWE